MTAQQGDLECVASEILRYLQRRPEATDTMDGIVQWWLPRLRLEEAAETVQHALDLLEHRGLVERVLMSPRLTLYRRIRIARASAAARASATRSKRKNPH
jgi:hypothetical protein